MSTATTASERLRAAEQEAAEAAEALEPLSVLVDTARAAIAEQGPTRELRSRRLRAQGALARGQEAALMAEARVRALRREVDSEQTAYTAQMRAAHEESLRDAADRVTRKDMRRILDDVASLEALSRRLHRPPAGPVADAIADLTTTVRRMLTLDDWPNADRRPRR